MIINVLVSGVGGDVAQGVIKCLGQSDLKFRIYKIAATTQDSWLYLDNDSYISPLVSDKNYINYICGFIKKHNIHVFIPCIDSEIEVVSRNKNHIETTTGVPVAIGDYEKIQICHDKLKTSYFLKEAGLCSPESWPVTDVPPLSHFPLILKTRSGCGSKNVYDIKTLDDLKSASYDESYMLQEKLYGDEYTAGCYIGNDGEAKGVCILKRQLKGGSTYYAERVIDTTLEHYIIAITKTLGLKYLNIQFRLKNNLPCPFEFNGRFSGTTGIIGRVFNAPEMYIRELVLNQHIDKIDSYEKFYVMRYYEEIYASEKDISLLLKRGTDD
tara:strand:+ start:6670 stop:7647 length:978 start_codon:yes stop_codon:yes gene_type:complete